MPALVLTRVIRPGLQRIPFAWAAARGLMDAGYRVALLPFGRSRPRGVAREAAGLVPLTDELNRRAEQLVGRVATVEETMVHGQGRVRVGDTVWTAQGCDAPAGAPVRVTAAQGAVLIVRRI